MSRASNTGPVTVGEVLVGAPRRRTGDEKTLDAVRSRLTHGALAGTTATAGAWNRPGP